MPLLPLELVTSIPADPSAIDEEEVREAIRSKLTELTPEEIEDHVDRLSMTK